MHVRHVRRGRLAHDGTGLSFFFRPLSAVLSEVPVDDRELPLLFHARTADFQDLAVQASVTFRVTDPATACTRIDFSVDPNSGKWRGAPLEQVGGLLTETAQQQVIGLVAASTLASALAEGIGEIRDRILHGLAADSRLAETGITVVGARVIALRPEPDVEKALRTPARELIQTDADRATYERRALAVERERAIAENELRNQIELARQEEHLIAQRGVNARRQATEAAAADEIEAGRAPPVSGSWQKRPRTKCARSARHARRPTRPGSPPTGTSRRPRCSEWPGWRWPGTCPRSARWCSRLTCSPG